ncbi:hypothetical protein [Ornithinicoccus hortensis]|uniref:Uncharacterized protein n=1 Tax=Ornithinicoccus hortensis TaxID=82346 RepID=A0A542YVS2_9MICO|nr:hypothetical protein [Ornithinicoccus hortensis]TQL52180.1 hypothetical protein FB467_3358 [Ornithinicoccus hortensis]
MRRALVSALAVPVLLLSACGSDDDGAEVVEPNGQTTEETTDDAAEETDDTAVEETDDDAAEETDDTVLGGGDDAEATEDEGVEDGIGATQDDEAEDTDGDDSAAGESASGDEQAAADRTKEWFVAFVSGDEAVCDMMLDFVGDPTVPMKDSENYDLCRNMIPGMVGDIFADSPEIVGVIESMEINGATVEGDTATITQEHFSDMFGEAFGDTEIKLKNIDGEWYVDMNSLSGM